MSLWLNSLKLVLPLGFIVGAGMEVFMVKVAVNGENFCTIVPLGSIFLDDVAKRKRKERLIKEIQDFEDKIKLEKEKDNVEMR